MKNNDVGSTEVQIRKLHADILRLSQHVQNFKKDNATKRTLYRKVSYKKKLFSYLEKYDYSKFVALSAELK
ncbi:MAG: 30S ribosomal protein S15 [Mycoplasmataceae bacterium]|jgi:small subunit ribosomal protein S15|nr:30S ribosomal protein S15 [Mycoplasmataceae bacterium]